MTSSALSKASADFALNLLREVGNPGQDAVFSPMSIALALAMTYTGARGNTEKQMNSVLLSGMKAEDAHKGFGTVMEFLNKKDVPYELHSANRLYAQKDFNLLAEFLDIVRKNYQSDLKSVDFKSEADKVRQEINKWVEEVTKEKIKDLVAPGILNALTRLVLVNAVYFKGTWKKQFDESDTSKKPFHVSPGVEKKVDMMYQKSKFLYNSADDLQVLGMPYVGEELAMFILLPKERFGLAELEKSLTAERLLRLIEETRTTEVIVELPRFKLEQSFSLNDALARLGMKDMFTDDADFSGMTGARDLFVSAVVHKAFIEVNEEGSEAAAATYVSMSRSRSSSPAKVQKFLANHPFFFAVVSGWNSVESLQLLFAGHAGDIAQEVSAPGGKQKARKRHGKRTSEKHRKKRRSRSKSSSWSSSS